MQHHQKKSIRRVAFAIAALSLLVPVTVSTSQGIAPAEACADGACCREMMSTCLSDGKVQSHYYTDQDGDCNTMQQ